MGAIMIRCPQTGREIPTGIEMDTAEFQRAPVFFSRVQCPVCAANMSGSPRTHGYATPRTRNPRGTHSLTGYDEVRSPEKLVRRTASVGGRGERRPAPA
jgi:hypothetical protein